MCDKVWTVEMKIAFTERRTYKSHRQTKVQNNKTLRNKRQNERKKLQRLTTRKNFKKYSDQSKQIAEENMSVCKFR